MNIPANLILLWAGTHAGIPTKWVRETTLDGKYPKAWGDAVTPDTTGGASTHTHTSPSHTHAIADHTHTYTNGAIPSRDTAHTHIGGTAALLQHQHTGNTGGVATTNNFGSTAVTYGAVSNDPPHHELIFIKAQAGAIIENDIIALWNGWDAELATPDNWQYCNGSNGSPDLRNKYVKGAGTGANAGTTGGSTTNVHDITHGHTGASHTQGGFTTGTGTGGTIANTGSCCSVVLGHTHSYSATDATTVTPNTYSDPLTTTETVEPAYTKLGAIQKKANGIKVRGIIGMWLGDIEDIPAGWVVCDGTNDTPDLRDKFIKIATDSTEFGDTGGANTHTHGAQAHAHTTPAHTHFVNQTKNHQGISQVGINEIQAGNADDTIADSTHGTFTTDSATPNTTSVNTTADSSANQPEYRTVAYVQFQVPTDGGAFLENFM